jgi:hypothetical protein
MIQMAYVPDVGKCSNYPRERLTNVGNKPDIYSMLSGGRLDLEKTNIPNLLLLNCLMNKNTGNSGMGGLGNLYGSYGVDPRYTLSQQNNSNNSNSNVFLQQILSNCAKKGNTTNQGNTNNMQGMAFNPLCDLSALGGFGNTNPFMSYDSNSQFRTTNESEASNTNSFQNSMLNLYKLLGYKNVPSMPAATQPVNITNKMNNITNFNFFNNLFNVADMNQQSKSGKGRQSK